MIHTPTVIAMIVACAAFAVAMFVFNMRKKNEE